MKIAFNTEFDCPAPQLWDYMTESANLPHWVPEIVAFRLTSESPDMVGSTYEVDTKRGKKTTTCFGETLEWEPNRRLKEQTTGGGFKEGQAMITTYDITEHADRCSMVYTMDFNCGILMGLMFKTMGKSYCKKMINRLKQHAEAAGPE